MQSYIRYEGYTGNATKFKTMKKWLQWRFINPLSNFHVTSIEEAQSTEAEVINNS